MLAIRNSEPISAPARPHSRIHHHSAALRDHQKADSKHHCARLCEDMSYDEDRP